LVDFSRGEPLPDPKELMDEALKYLLDRDMISMSWEPDAEEFLFYMTDEQKKKPLPNNWETEMP